MILHLVTDRRQLVGASVDLDLARQCLLRQARHAIEAEVDVVQIRERDLEASDLAALTSEVVAMARGSRTRVLVNDRVDIALACGATGVHLRADSVPAAAVRSIAPSGFMIGRSVHSVEEAAAAASHVDYLIAGAVWPSLSKPEGHAVLGVEGLSAIVRTARVPVLAIGGVTVERSREIAACGAAGVAAISLFMAPASVSSPGSCRAVVLRSTVEAARGLFDTSPAAS